MKATISAITDATMNFNHPNFSGNETQILGNFAEWCIPDSNLCTCWGQNNLQRNSSSGLINVQFCRSEEQLADIFTKALPKDRFKQLRLKLGVKPVNSLGEAVER
jgi:hypothetical protein